MNRIGIVVGRFQVKKLHEGHMMLLRHAHKESDVLLILLGTSRCEPNRREPEDFKTRQLQMNAAYPEAVVLPIFDQASDEVWSNQLTNLVYSLYPDLTKATIYGGRDSCLDHYTGPFSRELVSDLSIGSGTLERERDARFPLATEDFRHGCIYTAYHMRPSPLMAVDIAIMKPYEDKNRSKLLLGRKGGETKWRFPGGKVDIDDTDLETCGAREAHEETGLVVDPKDLRYISSHLVDDWRYRDNPDKKIMTTLYLVNVKNESIAKAGDDLKEVQWFDLNSVTVDDINPTHVPLLKKLQWYMEVANV